MFTMCMAMCWSSRSFFSSNITKNKSNLDIIGADISMLYLSDLDLSYLPIIELAAAKLLALAFKVA